MPSLGRRSTTFGASICLPTSKLLLEGFSRSDHSPVGQPDSYCNIRALCCASAPDHFFGNVLSSISGCEPGDYGLPSRQQSDNFLARPRCGEFKRFVNVNIALGDAP